MKKKDWKKKSFEEGIYISPFCCHVMLLQLPPRKQEELEARFIEEETQRRIDELVAERVAAEIQKRKAEIEEEVLKRVEEAKRVMERQLVEEMERKQKQQEEDEERKKVSSIFISSHAKQLISVLFLL